MIQTITSLREQLTGLILNHEHHAYHAFALTIGTNVVELNPKRPFALSSSYYASKFTTNMLMAVAVFFSGSAVSALFLRKFFWLIPIEQHVGVVSAVWILYAYFPFDLVSRIHSVLKVPALAIQSFARAAVLHNFLEAHKSGTLHDQLPLLPIAFLYIAGDLICLNFLPDAMGPRKRVSHRWTLFGLFNAIVFAAFRSTVDWHLPHVFLSQSFRLEEQHITALIIFCFALPDELARISFPTLSLSRHSGRSTSTSPSLSSSSDMKIVHLGGGVAAEPFAKSVPSVSQFASLLIHADHDIEKVCDVAPPLHVSTNFKLDNRDGLGYAREDTITRRRAEKILGDLDGGHAVLFSSGLAAAFTALLHFKPKRVAIDGGYFGTHSVLRTLRDSSAASAPNSVSQFECISLNAEPQKGDVWWLESPKNPRCELVDIAEISKRVHTAGGVVVVDATFASPILVQPLKWGADIVMHSTTKFLNGHGDAMGGALVSSFRLAQTFHHIRSNIGNIPGELECWLLLRSLRTLSLRVERQAKSAEQIALWLSQCSEFVEAVHHPSLANCPGHDLWGEGKQMRCGPGILSFELKSAFQARHLPQHLKVWTNATSLGGVESLVDYRHRYDSSVSAKLIRASVGLENPQDLTDDLLAGFKLVAELERNAQKS